LSSSGVKGAYTDARETRTGRFEDAQGGALFWMKWKQAKLLTVLQNRQVTRLEVPTKALTETIDIRLICATNPATIGLANENRFRKDLIYRINTVESVCRHYAGATTILLCTSRALCQEAIYRQIS